MNVCGRNREELDSKRVRRQMEGSTALLPGEPVLAETSDEPHSLSSMFNPQRSPITSSLSTTESFAINFASSPPPTSTCKNAATTNTPLPRFPSHDLSTFPIGISLFHRSSISPSRFDILTESFTNRATASCLSKSMAPHWKPLVKQSGINFMEHGGGTDTRHEDQVGSQEAL